MRKVLFIIFLLLIGAGGYRFVTRGEESKAESEQVAGVKIEEAALPVVPEKPKYQMTEYVVEGGDVFAVVMEKLGFGYRETMAILEAASSTYDFTKIKAGRPLRVYKNDGGSVVKLEYEKNSEEIIRVEFSAGTYTVSVVPIEYEVERSVITGTVLTSLWTAGLEAGMSEDLLVKFADVFAWTIDFSVQVQTGDSFAVLYEKRFRDGKEVGVGRVLAGEFVNNGKSLKAYLFEDETGKPTYYSDTGESLQKQFLKAPVEFKRITSGFTYARFDPFGKGTVRPHRAIDYAAAMGTPIMAVGDGVVEFAGWSTQGYGNFVVIRHNDTYTTRYAHMSKFGPGIKKGVRVSQSQVIGYVGSTGYSTGPHLHYEIMKNGVLTNPLEIELPPGEPVSGDKRAAFDEKKVEFDRLLKK